MLAFTESELLLPYAEDTAPVGRSWASAVHALLGSSSFDCTELCV